MDCDLLIEVEKWVKMPYKKHSKETGHKAFKAVKAPVYEDGPRLLGVPVYI
jgi:hypothetical protein